MKQSMKTPILAAMTNAGMILLSVCMSALLASVALADTIPETENELGIRRLEGNEVIVRGYYIDRVPLMTAIAGTSAPTDHELLDGAFVIITDYEFLDDTEISEGCSGVLVTLYGRQPLDVQNSPAVFVDRVKLVETNDTQCMQAISNFFNLSSDGER